MLRSLCDIGKGVLFGRPAQGGRGGFSLLELMAVIFLVSLLAALAFPSFTGFGENKLRSDARRIASLLRYLNDGATAEKQTFPLKFVFKESLLSWQGPDGEKTGEFKSLAGIYLPSKGTIREGEATVFFSPLGIQEQLEVLLKDEEAELRVVLNPLSGRVKIVEAGAS